MVREPPCRRYVSLTVHTPFLYPHSLYSVQQALLRRLALHEPAEAGVGGAFRRSRDREGAIGRALPYGRGSEGGLWGDGRAGATGYATMRGRPAVGRPR